MDEARKKAGLIPIEEEVNKTIQKIDLTNHTITISDMPDFNKRKFADLDDDDEEDDDENVDEAAIKETKKEKKLVADRELSKITEKLEKLEKRRFELDHQGTGKKNIKSALKKRSNTQCNKSTRKFTVKDKKVRKKKSIKKAKKNEKRAPPSK
jgi:hypothetical protein